MKILKIEAFPNGAHSNQEWDKLPIPDGWAVIPEDMELENFPFGNVTAEELDGAMTVTGWESIPMPEPEAEKVIAPHNVLAGEYITIGGVLYLATGNIPNGEPVIVGQNAVITTVEAQLNELKGE